MQPLYVELGTTRYPIHIGPGLLGDAASFAAAPAGRDILIVSNATVAPLYSSRLRSALPGRRLAECILPDGERYKTLATVGLVLDALVAQRCNRDAVVLALGGGVVGDIAGFAAACYQRGISFVQVPTTLLAQVDSSVGGKTGVNHPGGKNLIGAFHQPVAVVADTDTLASLPDRELRAGLAEVIKYGCIYDAELFHWLEHNIARLLAREPEALIHAIRRSCEIKATVVAADERERDVRAILNFGHTFGHAIEAATNFDTFLHGEAVGFGMLLATELSARLGLVDAQLPARLAALLAASGLPVETPRIGVPRALDLMQMDKKVKDGKIRLVLLDRLGRAVVRADAEESALRATLDEHFA
jgi:3-dehydroquinate synthase